MADAAVRTMERALAAGDEGVRPALVAAYLRAGRGSAALDLLGSDQLTPDLLGLEESLWRQELGRLSRAGRVPGLRNYLRVVGWFSGRFAAVQATEAVGSELQVFDRRRVELVDPEWPPRLEPLATTRTVIFGKHNGRLVVVSRHGEGWRTERLDPFPGDSCKVHPDGARLIMGRMGLRNQRGSWYWRFTVYELPTMREGRSFECEGSCAIDWERDRVVWLAEGRLQAASISGDEPPKPVGPGLYRSPEPFRFLEDGRLLLGVPLTVIDIDRGVASTVTWTGRLMGSVMRLSRDRKALLVFRGGAPKRVPLKITLRRSVLPLRRPDSVVWEHPPGVWHPRADLAAHPPTEKSMPKVLAADGSTLCRLPSDSWPLAWTPDGLGLLLVRQVGRRNGLLELWAPGGAR